MLRNASAEDNGQTTGEASRPGSSEGTKEHASVSAPLPTRLSVSIGAAYSGPCRIAHE